MKERGELPNEGGDVVREYKAMHEEDFWSSWLRVDEKSKGRKKKLKLWEKEEKRVKSGKEKRRKKENETATVRRRCEGLGVCGSL